MNSCRMIPVLLSEVTSDVTLLLAEDRLEGRGPGCGGYGWQSPECKLWSKRSLTCDAGTLLRRFLFFSFPFLFLRSLLSFVQCLLSLATLGFLGRPEGKSSVQMAGFPEHVSLWNHNYQRWGAHCSAEMTASFNFISLSSASAFCTLTVEL